MLTLRGIITILVLAGLFALAVVWISKQGGWKGEGCGGNCASCVDSSCVANHEAIHRLKDTGKEADRT